jgi:DNA-nicking Smr family endonuclease
MAEVRVMVQPLTLPRQSSVLLNRPQCSQAHASGSAVLQVVQAHVGHGGGGAYYVWLRKRR